MNISLDKYIWNTFLNDATNMLSDTFLDDATGTLYRLSVIQTLPPYKNFQNPQTKELSAAINQNDTQKLVKLH